MHSLETNAIMRCLSPPKMWLRYVDDTFIIIKRSLLNELFQLINNMSETIKFSKEVESDENELAFLDCLVKRKLDGKFKINIFRKPTNSDRYLDYHSAHPFTTKVTVAKNLINRAKRLVTEEEDINEELKLVQSTLESNNYPKAFIKRYLKCEDKDESKPAAKNWVSTAVVPYRKETSDEIKRILNEHNIRVYFRASNTLRSLLVKVKDKIEQENQQNCVYQINCGDCNAVYVGETSRQVNIRMKEHKQCLKVVPKSSADLKKLENNSAIALHSIETGHKIDFDKTKVLQKGFGSYQERLTAEALHIWVNPNSLNRREGVMLADAWQILTNKQNKI
uniref:Helix-turn-helix domain-containing protein n=1 Tax=Trichobilharzia regenti TaxID=157069 RepID=A0AA85IVA9_TRIRE|nr:unnamed protein product [Trichobilharzia regenti]